MPLVPTRGLSIDFRVYVISQHVRWPIKAPLPTCANQDAWVVIMPKRPKANSIHIATWHAWTETSPHNIVQKVVFSLIHLAASFIRLWPLCHSDLGGSIHGWGQFLKQTQYPQERCSVIYIFQWHKEAEIKDKSVWLISVVLGKMQTLPKLLKVDSGRAHFPLHVSIYDFLVLLNQH